MTGPRRLALVLGVAVLVGTLPATAGAVDAAPMPEDAVGESAACDGVNASGNVLVATVPSTGERVQGEASLYANVTLDLRLCGPEGAVTPYGDAWSLAGDDGYTVLDTTNEGPRIRLEPGYAEVVFPAQVRKKQVERGLVVTEPEPNAVEPALAVADRLYFSSSAAVESYRAHEDEFLNATEEARSAVTALNESAAALEGDGSTSFDASAANDTLDAVNDSVGTLAASGSAFRGFLFDAVGTSPTPGVVVESLQAVGDRERADRSRAVAAVTAYQSALEERRQSLAAAVRGNLLLAGGLGLLLGVLGGAALPYLVANRTIGRKRIDSTADYNRYALWVPVGGGVLLVAATVGVVAATTGLSLFGVIL
jgi:hypothetical protein